MVEEEQLTRVEILIEQQRFETAEEVLKELLAMDANNVQLLTMLSEVSFQQDKLDIASSLIDNAIGLAPDAPHLYYIKARIEIQEENYIDAEKNINQAIELYPFDADYFAVLGSIKLARKEFDTALAMTNKALEIDSENLVALNIRSTALVKLNRSEESFDTIEGALREDPNNAFTHANYGWGLLEKGAHEKALEHFKESLNSDPNFDYAQSGILEALKAKNPIYRLFLRYSFWISNLTAKYQWAVIIGFYMGVKALRVVAKNNAALQPYLTPVIIVLALIAFSTWILTPISNLFLRFNKYGELLLEKKEKMSSNFVAVSLITSIIGVLAYVVLSDEKFLTIAVFGFAMMLPFSVMFTSSKPKNALLIYAVGMTVIGLLAISKTFSNNELFNSLTGIFIFSFIAFQWTANFIMIKEDAV